jgi:alkanesulfonate monooxygenase SsuD/methylene tetrahydromethanopterin reductase-like flavin-dependent oxidoreductase (luciferase family)
VNLRRGRLGPLPPPIDDIETFLSPLERLEIGQTLSAAVVGSPDTVRDGLAEFISRTAPDELIVVAQIFDHTARLRSYEITAGARAGLARATGAGSR